MEADRPVICFSKRISKYVDIDTKISKVNIPNYDIINIKYW